MTLSLATLTSYGIVLTADSRQTYQNAAGMTRIGSDSAMKLFQLNNKTAVVIAGRGFLPDERGVIKSTGWYINEFKQKYLTPDLSTKQIAESLNTHLAGIFVEKAVKALEDQIRVVVVTQGGSELEFKARDTDLVPYSYKNRDGKSIEDAGRIDTIEFIVAGVDNDKIARAYSVKVPTGIQFEGDIEKAGFIWIGQYDVLERIIRGYSREIGTLDFVKNEITAKGLPNINAELAKLQYVINWSTMTLQDAIDFGVLITRTTESIQRFSDGTLLAPGGITGGVGGDIDIAIITPEKGFVWFKTKVLRSEGKSLSLDEEADV
jgi:hypothetical protein